MGEIKMTKTHVLFSRSSQVREPSVLGSVRTERVTLTLAGGSRESFT